MPDTYEELFAQLERNVELLKSDGIGLGERVALCRESRSIAQRCIGQLDDADRQIDELRLDDLLIGRDRHAVLTPVEPSVRARDPALLLSARLMLVGRALELAGREVGLATLAAGIAPAGLAALAEVDEVVEELDLDDYLDWLTPAEERELDELAARLEAMARDPQAVESFDLTMAMGHDAFSELAREMTRADGAAP